MQTANWATGGRRPQGDTCQPVVVLPDLFGDAPTDDDWLASIHGPLGVLFASALPPAHAAAQAAPPAAAPAAAAAPLGRCLDATHATPCERCASLQRRFVVWLTSPQLHAAAHAGGAVQLPPDRRRRPKKRCGGRHAVRWLHRTAGDRPPSAGVCGRQPAAHLSSGVNFMSPSRAADSPGAWSASLCRTFFLSPLLSPPFVHPGEKRLKHQLLMTKEWACEATRNELARGVSWEI